MADAVGSEEGVHHVLEGCFAVGAVADEHGGFVVDHVLVEVVAEPFLECVDGVGDDLVEEFEDLRACGVGVVVDGEAGLCVVQPVVLTEFAGGDVEGAILHDDEDRVLNEVGGLDVGVDQRQVHDFVDVCGFGAVSEGLPSLLLDVGDAVVLPDAELVLVMPHCIAAPRGNGCSKPVVQGVGCDEVDQPHGYEAALVVEEVPGDAHRRRSWLPSFVLLRSFLSLPPRVIS
ncbi:hypothetical protein ES703_103050 [subsurface metagenome]